MRITHLDPKIPSVGMKGTVYEDSTLGLEHAQAYLIATQKKNDGELSNRIVLRPSSTQGHPLNECVEVMRYITLRNSDKNIPEDKKTPPACLVEAGYFSQTGEPTEKFNNTAKEPELVFLMSDGKVLVSNKKGLYLTTTKPETRLLPREQESLSGLWYSCHPSDPGYRDKLSQTNHFHYLPASSPEEASKKVDHAITCAQAILESNDPTQLDLTEIADVDRADIVQTINGQPDPRGSGEKFGLQHVDQDYSDYLAEQRAQQTEFLNKNAKAFRERMANQGESHISVTLQLPEFACNPRDLNQINATSGGMKNSYNFEKNELIAESKLGGLPYRERFKEMGLQLKQLLGDDISYPIKIKAIEPPERDKECRAAFNSVFGEGNVKFPGDDLKKKPAQVNQLNQPPAEQALQPEQPPQADNNYVTARIPTF